MPLFFLLVGLLGCLYIWIGSRAQKGLKTEDDYFLMGRNLTFFPLFLTLVATQLGGGTLLGAAQEAYRVGWSVLLYPMGAAIGLVLLGLGFGQKLRALEISTVSEIFEVIYKSTFLRKVASSLSIMTLFLILVSQGIGAKIFFSAMGVDSTLFFAAFWIVFVAYTVMGGFKAVVQTDVLQAVCIISILILAFFYFEPVMLTSSQVLQYESDIPYLSWLLMPLLFMLIEQDMGQRCFAAKNAKAIFWATILASVVLFAVSSIAIFFGIKAKECGLLITGSDSILMQSVAYFTNPVLLTFFAVAIFTAILSTADSLLSAISSHLVCDFIDKRKVSEKERIKKAKMMTFLVGVVSLFFALFFDNVVAILMLSYKLSVYTLFVPIVLSLFLEAPSQKGALFSIIGGAIGFCFFSEIPALFTSALGFIAGSRREKVFYTLK